MTYPSDGNEDDVNVVASERVHRTVHSIEVDAAPGIVYGLISDAVQWPLFFPPNVYVERLESDGAHERLRMWATAGGGVRSWVSQRTLDPRAQRIEFRQTRPSEPVETMSGTWSVEEQPGGTSLLTLCHAFTVAGDRPADVAWVNRACDHNSGAELDNIKRLAERWAQLDELVLSFEDSVRVEGSAEDVYDFLYRAADWPELVPHVSRVDLTEESPGVQIMSMDTRTADGSAHTTESVRVCFPHTGRIVYKQTATPALMAAHTGAWSVVPDAAGVTVFSQHSVVLREEAVQQVLGPGAGLGTARKYLRQALGRNSTATLRLAKQYAESAARNDATATAAREPVGAGH